MRESIIAGKDTGSIDANTVLNPEDYGFVVSRISVGDFSKLSVILVDTA